MPFDFSLAHPQGSVRFALKVTHLLINGYFSLFLIVFFSFFQILIRSLNNQFLFLPLSQLRTKKEERYHMDDEPPQRTASAAPLPNIKTSMKDAKQNLSEKEDNNWCRHRRPRRSSIHQEQITTWSQWRIKLLYAVIVPAAIVYLLLHFDHQHHHQHQHHAYHSQQPHHPYRPGATAGPKHSQDRHWKEYVTTQPAMVEDRITISKVKK